MTSLGSAYEDSTTEFHLVLLCGLDCPRAARREIGTRIASIVSTTVGEDVALLLTELVTNAIKHGDMSGDAVVTISGEVTGTSLRIEVMNPGAAFRPRPVTLGSGSAGGRGLYLVDVMSQAWGVRHEDGETSVWFEVDTQTPVPLPPV